MMHIKAQFAPQKVRGQVHDYYCHSACMYWALQTKYPNKSNEEIARLTEARATRLCPKCNGGGGGCHSFTAHLYGVLFPRFTRVSLATNNACFGDVIIFGELLAPAHSAVCVASGKGKLLVRGFNNIGQFALCNPMPPRDQYDPYVRDVSARSYPNDGLYIVRQKDYIEAIVNY
jgi:hypothetical protein